MFADQTVVGSLLDERLAGRRVDRPIERWRMRLVLMGRTAEQHCPLHDVGCLRSSRRGLVSRWLEANAERFGGHLGLVADPICIKKFKKEKE